ncbi:SusC/RagA family TonB-linked outer membrane protein [Echinicola sediminis]
MKNHFTWTNFTQKKQPIVWVFLFCLQFPISLSAEALIHLTENDRHQTTYQQVTITGKVTDENGEAIPGATILEKGTSNGTTTSLDGNFSISVNENAVLVISFIGYASKEIPIQNQSELTVILEEDLQRLDEVVVIGYGEQRRKDVTGAVASLTSEEMSNRISVHPLDNIQGKIAGVNVYNGSGRPGGADALNIQIRGKGSLSTSNQPLFVIDGVIGADISLINVNDIESISVLKDASATAIYGFKGANGVVLVTTKKGNKGGIQVDLTGNLQVGMLSRYPEMLSSGEYWNKVKSAIDQEQRDLGAPAGSFVDDYGASYPMLFNPDGSPKYNTNWIEETTRTSISQQYFANVRAGGENYNASISVGTQDDQGIILNTYAGKKTMRFSGDFDVNKWLKVGGNFSYGSTRTNIVDDYRVGANGLTSDMLFYLPIYPTRYEDGTKVYADDLLNPNGTWDIWYGATPKDRLGYIDRITERSQVLQSYFIDIKLAEGLKFKTTYSLQEFNEAGKTHTQKELDTFVNRTYGSVSNAKTDYIQFENLLSYNRTFSLKHDFSTLLGASWYQNTIFRSGMSTRDFDDFFGYYNLAQGTDDAVISSGWTRRRENSYFGRVNYSYDEKYMLTVTGRADGSSRFGTNNKYAFFPSAALGWKISNEDFLKGSSSIRNLKLRASYGLIGNDGIGDFTRIASPGNQQVIFNNQRTIGTSQGNLGNNDLQWEKTTDINLGFDLVLYDRIGLTADLYSRTTQNLLDNVPVPEFTGYSSITSNIGSVRNKGLEVLINTTNISKRDFMWTSTFNFTRNINEIVELGTEDADVLIRGQWFFDGIHRVGQPSFSFWGFRRLGTWGTQEEAKAAEYGRVPGDIKLEDVNEDGKIDSQDMQIIGNPLPDYNLNIGNNFSYKNWNLSFDIRIVKGADIMDYSTILYTDRMGYGNVYKELFEQAWTPENQNTMFPRVRKDLKAFNGMDSGHIFDASFIRGQNLSLSYTFGDNILKMSTIKAAQVYFNLQNFFVITKYHGYDPEISSFRGENREGRELNGYPKPLLMNFGVKVSL